MGFRPLGRPFVLLMTLAAVLLAPRPAQACVCAITRPTYLGPQSSPRELLRDGVRSAFGDAHVVFTAETTAADMFAATFRVDELWKGTVDEAVTIKSGAERLKNGDDIISSCSRTFAAHTKYVVFAHRAQDGAIVTDACTPAYKMDSAAAVIAELDALASRRKPVAGSR